MNRTVYEMECKLDALICSGCALAVFAVLLVVMTYDLIRGRDSP